MAEWLGCSLRLHVPAAALSSATPGKLFHKHVRASATKQYTFGTGASWEGNRRSGVALAMCQRHSGLSIYGVNDIYDREMTDEHPVYAPFGPGTLYPVSKLNLSQFTARCSSAHLYFSGVEPAVSIHSVSRAVDHTPAATCHTSLTHLHRSLLIYRSTKDGQAELI